MKNFILKSFIFMFFVVLIFFVFNFIGQNEKELEVINKTNISNNYQYESIKSLPEMPFKNVFSSIIQSEFFDISILQASQSDDIYVRVIEKERNVDKNTISKEAPRYVADVLGFSIVSKSQWNVLVQEGKNDFLKTGNMNLRQENFNGVIWNYYDFPDGYDGGYARTYFIENNNYILSFEISDELVTEYPNPYDMPKIKFLEKLNFNF